MPKWKRQNSELIAIVSKILAYAANASNQDLDLGLDFFYRDVRAARFHGDKMEQTRRAILNGAPFTQDIGE